MKTDEKTLGASLLFHWIGSTIITITVVLMSYNVGHKDGFKQGYDQGFTKGEQMSNGCVAHDRVECEILRNND